MKKIAPEFRAQRVADTFFNPERLTQIGKKNQRTWLSNAIASEIASALAAENQHPDTEEICVVKGFGIGAQNEPGIVSTMKLSPDGIVIDNAKYPPTLIIEAAMYYLEYAQEHNWDLKDIGGLHIDRDATIRDWIKQITPKDGA